MVRGGGCLAAMTLVNPSFRALWISFQCRKHCCIFQSANTFFNVMKRKESANHHDSMPSITNLKVKWTLFLSFKYNQWCALCSFRFYNLFSEQPLISAYNNRLAWCTWICGEVNWTNLVIREIYFVSDFVDMPQVSIAPDFNFFEHVQKGQTMLLNSL